LNARNALLGRTLPMDQKQYGATAGGPLRRDRTFYFSNVEQRTLHQAGLVTIAPEHAAVINARLAEIGYRGASVATGLYHSPVDSTTVLGKIDHQVSGSNQVGLRYSLYRVNADNSRVRIEGLVEGFNITNRTNVVARNANFGTGAYPALPLPTFGQITAVADPRTAQLGVRLKF
jgi:hypothetical protein